MKRYGKNIWELYESGLDVVVTTNIGWTLDTYRNNMGAGTVMEAARRWPELPEWYGRQCAAMAEAGNVQVLYRPDLGLWFLPVKPLLDASCPEMSWNQTADLDLIRQGLRQLRQHPDRLRDLAMTLPGAGNGFLDPEMVLVAVEQELNDTPGAQIVLCDAYFSRKR